MNSPQKISPKTESFRGWLQVASVRKEVDTLRSEMKKLVSMAEDPDVDRDDLAMLKEQIKARRTKLDECQKEIDTVKQQMFAMLLRTNTPDLVQSVFLNLGVESDSLYGAYYAYRYLTALVDELKKRGDDLHLPLLREKKELENEITSNFWRLYEVAVNKYYYAAEENIDKETANVLRLYVRFGLFTTDNWTIDETVFAEILGHTKLKSLANPDDKIFHLDEYFTNILRQSKLPPSYDDEFERAGKHATGAVRDSWMFERAFRYLRVNLKDYKSMAEKLKTIPAEVEAAAAEAGRLDDKIKAARLDFQERHLLERKVKDKRKEAHDLSRLNERLAPMIQEKREELEEYKTKVAQFTKGCDIKHIFAREVNLIKTAVRVCAKDNNPLSFFRNRKFGGSPSMVTPDMIAETIEEIVAFDPHIFSRQPRLYHKVLSEHFYRQDRPIIVIGLPTLGERGFAAFGADERGEGTIFLPMFIGQPKKSIIRAFGHYRWQTAVNDAGADWQTFPNLRQEFEAWWRQIKNEYKRMQERHDPKLKDMEEPEKMEVKEFIRQYTYFIERQGTQWWTQNEELKVIFQRYITHTLRIPRSL